MNTSIARIANAVDITLDSDGVQSNKAFVPFRRPPADGYSRKEIAALCSINHGSLKRLEGRYADLVSGRTAKNARVLRYSAERLVAFAAARNQRLDLLAAIEIGFPLDQIPVRLIGCRALTPDSSGRVQVHSFPREQASQIVAAWAQWTLRQTPVGPVPLPPLDISTLDACTAAAIEVIVQAQLSEETISRCARSLSLTTTYVRDRAVRLSQRLRALLGTQRGRLLLAVLFAPEFI